MDITKKPRKQRTVTKPYQKHKTEKKITVKHYLNKIIKANTKNSIGEMCYPVYVRVTFYGQIANLRSATGITMTNTEFEEEHKNRLGFRRETELLKYVIEESYNIHLSPVWGNILSPFDLTSTLKHFDFHRNDLTYVIHQKLSDKISQYEWRKINKWQDADKKRRDSGELFDIHGQSYDDRDKYEDSDTCPETGPDFGVHPYLYILVQENDGVNYDELKKQYSAYIWLFSTYLDRLCKRYAVELDFLPVVITDYKSGLFEELFIPFMYTFKDMKLEQSSIEKAKRILNELKTLLD